MKELTDRALNSASMLGATYADVRVVHQENQVIQAKNALIEGISQNVSRGFGVRVLVDGAWGFASSSVITLAEIEETTRQAIRIAQASARVKGRPVELGPPVAHVDTYITPVEIDPFQVPLEEKTGVLIAATRNMQAVDGIVVAQASMECIREHKWFANSEGAFIEQTIIETGGGMECTSSGNGDVQKRSYPNSFGRHQGTAGYEFIEAMDLPGNARRTAEQAVALLSARQCPSGVTTVILDGTQVALQIHESCGHPIELDRVFGTEAAYAGTSFLTTDKLGSFRYGSEHVNITADATLPGGLGTFGYDDEGVPARRTPIVREGIFVGYLTSRETAQQLGQEQSNGTMRASGWNRIPLIRMTNVSLEAGDWTLEDLIADTEEGIYMETNKSWSIDDKRLNFQFGTEIAWEVRNGRLGDMLKNATYTGITPMFWGSCDAVCGENDWTLWGTPNCGKGQPSQIAHTGHGAAPARFRNIQVGVVR
jgi:TldD protein